MRIVQYGLAAVAACGMATASSFAGFSETIYGVTSTGFLANWQSDTPGQLDSSVALSGLAQNETIVSIDFRPLDGTLFGVGSSSRLYSINPATGLATVVGGGPFANTINGAQFGFDFNPTLDRARLVSQTDQNTVLNPLTGTSTPATELFYGAGDVNFGLDPNVVHNAYTNSILGGSSETVQYVMDSGLDSLATLANNAGTLSTVGSLGINIDATGGFDISGASGIAYAALLESGASASNLYTINLNTGAASLVGQIDGGLVITAMTVQIAPTPGAFALLGIAALISRSRRRWA